MSSLKIFFSKVLVMVLVTGIFSVPLAKANTLSISEQQNLELLKQVELLTKILNKLQSQLDGFKTYELTTASRIEALPNKPYHSKFYDFPHEAIYFVDGGLRYVEGERAEKQIDQQLFRLLVDTLGREVVDKSVREWRVFDRGDRDLGAYVELMSTTKNGPRNWIVGVNIEGYESMIGLTRSYADLFVHEYAHILLYDYPEITEEFADNFWSKADEENVARISQANENYKFNLAFRYYEANKSRFVSEYATNSVDEDMAETFVSFVRESRPEGGSVRDKKILYLYTKPELVEERNRLRDNLKALNVL